MGWLQALDQDLYRRLLGFLDDSANEVCRLGDEEKSKAEGQEKPSEIECIMRHILACTLKMPSQSIPLDRHFLGLGGDSLVAMRVVSKCKSAGLFVRIQDILTKRGIK